MYRYGPVTISNTFLWSDHQKQPFPTPTGVAHLQIIKQRRRASARHPTQGRWSARGRRTRRRATPVGAASALTTQLTAQVTRQLDSSGRRRAHGLSSHGSRHATGTPRTGPAAAGATPDGPREVTWRARREFPRVSIASMPELAVDLQRTHPHLNEWLGMLIAKQSKRFVAARPNFVCCAGAAGHCLPIEKQRLVAVRPISRAEWRW